MRQIPTLLALILPLVITGCGTAITTDKDELIADRVAPKSNGATPANNSLISQTISELAFDFSEPLSPESIAQENALTISPAIAGAWSSRTSGSGSPAAFQLVFTPSEPLPLSTDYTITLGTALTDLAGNHLPSNTIVNYRTAKDYFVKGTVTGLKGSLAVKDLVDGSTMTLGESDTTFTLAHKLFNNEQFRISLDQTGITEGMCTTTTPLGTINAADANVAIICDPVSPLHPLVADWNTHTTDASGLVYHAGERRKLKLTQSSCTGLTVSDALGVFDWTCEQDATTGDFFAKSTGIKDGKGLTDLINFSTLKWKQNRVIVKSGTTEVENTKLATWWNNPIRAITDATISWETNGVYVVNQDLTRQINISKANVAVLIDPTASFYAPAVSNDTGGIIISNNYVWFEGTVHANTNQYGIYLNTVYGSILRNVTVSGATGSGIRSDSSFFTYMKNIISSGNERHGIALTGTKKRAAADPLFSQLVSKANTSSNGKSGIFIESHYNNLENVTSANNTENGIYITGVGNRITQVNASSNVLAGLSLNNSTDTSDSTANSNRISHAISSSNGTGIDVRKSSLNLIANITLALNDVGIASIDTNTTSKIINIAEINNTASECAPGICDASRVVDTGAASNSEFSTPATDTTYFSDSNGSYDPITNLYSQNTITFTRTLQNNYRAWGMHDASAGYCGAPTLTCLIYEWIPMAASSLVSTNTTPTSLTHTFVEDTARTFISNAVEILGDGLGNDDGICETGSDEACVIINFAGGYSGAGTLSPVADTAWSDLGITAYQYPAL